MYDPNIPPIIGADISAPGLPVRPRQVAIDENALKRSRQSAEFAAQRTKEIERQLRLSRAANLALGISNKTSNEKPKWAAQALPDISRKVERRGQIPQLRAAQLNTLSIDQQLEQSEQYPQKCYERWKLNPDPIHALAYFQSALYSANVATLALNATYEEQCSPMKQRELVLEDTTLTFILSAVQTARKQNTLTTGDLEFVRTQLLRSHRDAGTTTEGALSNMTFNSLKNIDIDAVRFVCQVAEQKRQLHAKTLLRLAEVAKKVEKKCAEEVAEGEKCLFQDGPQRLENNQKLVENVQKSRLTVGGTYVHITEWEGGFITQDQGSTNNIKARSRSRRFSTKQEGGKNCQTILTFSFGTEPFLDSYRLMELRNMREVLLDKTLMDYKTIPFNSSYGLIDVPVEGTLNLNHTGSPARFPAHLRKAWPSKTFEAWQKMRDNPEWVRKVQNNEVPYNEFLRMGES